jgi:hypothetical protein
MIYTAFTATAILAEQSFAKTSSWTICIYEPSCLLQSQYKQLLHARQKMTDQTAKVKSPTETRVQDKIYSQQRSRTDTTRTTLPTYQSLASDNPPTYTHQPSKKPVIEKPTAGASAATVKAITGDPVPEKPSRSLRDRLLCRRESYNRRPPSSEREQGSSARWNVWGSPISDPQK